MDNVPQSPAQAQDGVKVIQIICPKQAAPAEPSVPITEDPVAALPSAIPNEEPAAAVPMPQPAVVTPPPSPDNLPPVTSTIAKQAAEMGLSVVNAERDGSHLFLVIEGEHVEDVTGADARKLAYDARFHYGFDNAGIEAHSGPVLASNATKYQQIWKLTRSML